MTQMRSAFCTVEPVGDDERRAVAREAGERLLHEPLRFGIERARRLVEQQDRRVLEDGARERQPLALAAGQTQARSPISVA